MSIETYDTTLADVPEESGISRKYFAGIKVDIEPLPLYCEIVDGILTTTYNDCMYGKFI